MRDGGGYVHGGGTRVHVHAQLTVLALRELGLSAAPSKVLVSNPVIALGFQVQRGDDIGGGSLTCPEVKRQSMRAAAAEAVALALIARARWRCDERGQCSSGCTEHSLAPSSDAVDCHEYVVGDSKVLLVTSKT